MTAFIARSVLCDLAVLGAVGGGLASSAHEWLLQRLAAVIAQFGIVTFAKGAPSTESMMSPLNSLWWSHHALFRRGPLT